MNLKSPTNVRFESDESGCAVELIYEEETITVNSLSESSVANLLHAKAKVLAVDYQVETAITGSDGDGFEIGIAGNTDAFASGVALTAGSNVESVIPDADSAVASAAPVVITITLEGDTPVDAPEAGVVHVGVWQAVFTAPSF